LHATARFFLAVLIGAGATLSWQAYGDEAQKMAVTRIPALAWLLPLSAKPSNAIAASSPDLAQQINPMALDIVAIRHQVEQLAENQGQLAADEGQIARSVAALQAMAQDVSQKISAIVEPKPAHLQPRKPAQRVAPSSIMPERQ
jgi:TolA-binding protein